MKTDELNTTGLDVEPGDEDEDDETDEEEDGEDEDLDLNQL